MSERDVLALTLMESLSEWDDVVVGRNDDVDVVIAAGVDVVIAAGANLADDARNLVQQWLKEMRPVRGGEGSRSQSLDAMDKHSPPPQESP